MTTFRWSTGLLVVGLLAVFAIIAAACSNVPVAQERVINCSDIPPGDPVAGETLFLQTMEQTSGRGPRCISCHAVDNNDQPNVGPGLAGIASVAAERVPDQSAAEYLCRAIVLPQEYVVEGYPEDLRLMPITYGEYLTQEQINDLVAYMLTLE